MASNLRHFPRVGSNKQRYLEAVENIPTQLAKKRLYAITQKEFSETLGLPSMSVKNHPSPVSPGTSWDVLGLSDGDTVFLVQTPLLCVWIPNY